MNEIQHNALKTDRDYSKYPFKNLCLENIEGEEWVNIPEFDGRLAVSNYGRVWALPREIHTVTGQVYHTKECIRKQVMSRRYNPYTSDYTEQLAICIRCNGKILRSLVNRLVYQLFVAPINFKEDHLRVVHIDGDNCNNHYKNLVLMDGVELYGQVLRVGRLPKSGRKRKKGNALMGKAAVRPVIQYTLKGKKIAEFESIAAASKVTGTHRASIRRVAQKKVIQLHGYVYRYKGECYRGEHSDFSRERPVTQYNIEGRKIERFSSVTKASEMTKISSKTISKAALRKFRFGSGYVWRYDGETYEGELKGTIRNKPKGIVQYTVGGVRKAQYKSVNQACKATGFCNTSLLNCAKKRSKLSYGFVWRFETENYKGEYKYCQQGKPITQYSNEGNKIKTYSTIMDAAEATELAPEKIQEYLKGKNRTAGEFIWRYAVQQVKKLSSLCVANTSELLLWRTCENSFTEQSEVRYTIRS
jgi:hypothetical protein